MSKILTRLQLGVSTFLLFGACGTAAVRPADSVGFREVWVQNLSGLLTDLAVADRSGDVLVSTIPDPQKRESERQPTLQFWGVDGKLRWKQKLAIQNKSQMISPDGKWIVTQNYREEVALLDARGKSKWQLTAHCRPYLVSLGADGSSPGILCHYDDSAKPDQTFEFYSHEGKKVSFARWDRDAIVLKFSQDQRWFATAFSGGGVALFSTDKLFKPGEVAPTARIQVAGEVTDLAVGGGEFPRVAILHHTEGSQHLSWFDGRSGRLEASRKVTVPGRQLEVHAELPLAFVYGNGARGQTLGHYVLVPGKVSGGGGAPGPGDLIERWTWNSHAAAEYSSPFIVSRDYVVFGLETSDEGKGSLLRGFDWDGKLRWSVPLPSKEDVSFLYAQGYSSALSTLVVATDDGRLRLYDLKNETPARESAKPGS